MIRPASLRDASYVLGNLREDDLRELSAQHQALDLGALGRMAARTPHTYIAYFRSAPAMVFGAAHMSATTVSLWGFGTAKTRRVVPAVTRFGRGPLIADLKRQGYRWAEARSIEGHAAAHRWLTGMGCIAVCDLPGYGKGGETFRLFRGAF